MELGPRIFCSNLYVAHDFLQIFIPAKERIEYWVSLIKTSTMAKSQDAKKNGKKEPLLTAKEKKAAKRDKKSKKS